VKAAEFYKLWNREVVDRWLESGVQKLVVRGSRWRGEVGGRDLLLFVETNAKYPWQIYSGGDFTINAYVPKSTPADPTKYVEDVGDTVSFFDYWDDDTAGLVAANTRVYEKMRNLDKERLFRQLAAKLDCTPQQAKESELYQSSLEMFAMDLEDPSGILVNPPLHYYDADDVVMWADLVSRAIPGVLKRMASDLRYSFNIASRD